MSEKPSHNHTQDRLRESLSATMDGEASELELRRVLDKIGNDEDLRNTAKRYQMIGDVMRNESSIFTGVDLSAGIRERLDKEAQHSPTTDSSKDENQESSVVSWVGGWWSTVGRVAVAASVALVFVLGVRNYNSQEAPAIATNPEPVTLDQPLQIAQGSYGGLSILAGYNSRQHDSISPEQFVQAQKLADRATRERFRAYALQHAEMSTMHSGQGMLPFARLTSFDAQ